MGFIDTFISIINVLPVGLNEFFEPKDYIKLVEFMSKYATKEEERKFWAMELEELKEELDV